MSITCCLHVLLAFAIIDGPNERIDASNHVPLSLFFFPSKLMGSSAQISSGVLRCSFLVAKFRKVPSKVAEGSGLGRSSGSGSRQGSGRLGSWSLGMHFWGRVPAKVRKVQSWWL